ncbi:very-long-chain 3-oxoacyl-CoA reductase-B-like [Hyperolius riggenbachi]|uniref:very-long-chain 3-oxoacyl-CoA reductase-B-like n=1 Tax=Hyperolius riggenbachi TaxID=752182 RepID=UPI0035A2E705
MADSVLYPGLTLLGAVTASHLLLRTLYKLLRGVRVHILSRWWRKDLKQYGEWAVVTGATDGIGKGYAGELAKRGFNVVLISRTREKLQKVANDIEQQTGRKTRKILADFTGGLEIYPSIEEGLKDLDIGILVNNVGMTMRPAILKEPFLCSPNLAQGLCDIVNCNMLSMVQMTRIVLPKMISRKKGLIINVSSVVGARPYRYYAVYSSSKGFADYFSRALHAEYKTRGITVQSVQPLSVSTNMSENAEPNLLVKSAADFAREALNTVGLANVTNGCLSHTIQSYLLDFFFPDSILNSRLLEMPDKEYQKRSEEPTKPKSQ